jgi:plastocyanin
MKQPIFRSALTLAAITLAALAVIPLATARINRQATAAATTVQVKGGEFFFRLSAKSATKPGKVTFSYTNIGHIPHDFKINGKQTPLIGPGKTAKLVVNFKKKGTYRYLCTVPGHAEAGMMGVFKIR